ncbi:MAG: acetoacetate decarboxylase family protein [Acidimicrobiia bacterium]
MTHDPSREFAFGPRTLPAVTSVERQHTTVVSFVTERDAVSWMLPRHFTATERPVVSVMHQQLEGVDYMRGRGYNLVNVAVTARFTGEQGTTVAPFPLVIWENHTMPIIAGRELHGNPKIFGDVSEVMGDARVDPSISFEVEEYGSTLIDAGLTQLRPSSSDALERTNAGSAEALIFGWRLIPNADGTIAIDEPTLIRGASQFERTWTGTGELTIHRRVLDEAPYSSHVVQALADLPQVEMRRAFHGVGTAQLFRNRTVVLS